jgi:DNA-damage-inducible protein J
MSINAVVRARIDKCVKEEASAILEAVGLTVSDAVRMMLVRTVAEKALPFYPLVPNADTIKALKTARNGKSKAVGDLESLKVDLNADN